MHVSGLHCAGLSGGPLLLDLALQLGLMHSEMKMTGLRGVELAELLSHVLCCTIRCCRVEFVHHTKHQ